VIAARAAEVAALQAEWTKLSAPFQEAGMPDVRFVSQEDHEATSERELSFREGNKLRVLSLNPVANKAAGGGEIFWLGAKPVPGTVNDVERGMFPPTHGQVIVTGPLEKKGMGTSVFSKPYATRDVIFDGMTGILTYAEKQRSKSVEIGANSTVVTLNPKEADGKNFAFRITCDRVDEEGKKHADKNSLQLVANSDACRACWIGCIEMSLRNRNTSGTS